MIKRHIASLVVLLGLFAASDARAEVRRIALLGIKGRGGDQLASQIQSDLSDVYQLVPADRFVSTFNTTAGGFDERVRQTARKLSVDALMSGTIAPGRKLRIIVRDGRSGGPVFRNEYDFVGRPLSSLRERVVSDIARVLDELGRHPAAAAAAVAQGESEEEAQEPMPRATDAGEAEAGEPAIRRGGPVPLVHGIFVEAGPTLTARWLSFDTPSSPSVAGGAVFGFHLGGSLFPFAFVSEFADTHPVLASFGLSAFYERAFDYTSKNDFASSSATGSRWAVLFIGKIPLGHRARGGVLTLESGYQQIGWSSSSPQDLGVPDVTYALLDGGASWRHALGTRRVWLSLRLAAQVLLDTGPISSGAEYGDATGFGVEAGAGLEVRPKSWLFLRLTGRFTSLSLNFVQNGARFAHSASDRMLDGQLEIGFAL